MFDVNTDYFETHGGYEYAKQFYAEVYELAKGSQARNSTSSRQSCTPTSATGKPVTG